MPGVRDDELAVVEHVVADQAVEERARPASRNSGGSRLELRERLGEPVRDLHVAARAASRTSLTSWLPGTQSAVPAATIAMHEPQHVGDVAARGRPGRRGRRACGPAGWPRASGPSSARVAELARAAPSSSSTAAVDVADDVERAVLVAAVVPERLRARSSPPRPPRASAARGRGGSPRARRPRSERRSCCALAADDVRRRSRGRAASRLRSWQSRSGRSNTIATGRQWYCARQRDQRLARLRLDVGRVDHGQPPAPPAACRR